MGIYPEGIRKQLTIPLRARPDGRIPMYDPKVINIHTGVTNSFSLAWSGNTPTPSGRMGYFNTISAGGVFSHLYGRQDLKYEQMQNTFHRSACDLDINPISISIEHWDGYGKIWFDGDVPPAWSEEALEELSEVVAWCFFEHPSIPRKLATSNLKGWESWGLSYHALGSPGLAKYTREQGGQYYTNARGKTCPGRKRIAQIPQVFRMALAKLDILEGKSLPGAPVQEEDDMPYTEAQLSQIVQNATRVAVLGVIETPRYREYIDENGDAIMDVRSLSDIFYSTHKHAVSTNRGTAALAEKLGVDENKVVSLLVEALTPRIEESVRVVLGNLDLPESLPYTLDEIGASVTKHLGEQFNK